MVTAGDLNKYLGKNISAICGNGYTAPDNNHCAHFVSHAMEYTFGYTCKAASVGAKAAAANLRVHEVFARCPTVGRWADKPAPLLVCLVFVTASSHVNVAMKAMTNVSSKAYRHLYWWNNLALFEFSPQSSHSNAGRIQEALSWSEY